MEAAAFERMTRRMGMAAEPYRVGPGRRLHPGRPGAVRARGGRRGARPDRRRRGRAISALSGASLLGRLRRHPVGHLPRRAGLGRRPEVHGRPAAGTARGPPAGTGRAPSGTGRYRRTAAVRHLRARAGRALAAGHGVSGAEREAGSGSRARSRVGRDPPHGHRRRGGECLRRRHQAEWPVLLTGSSACWPRPRTRPPIRSTRRSC